MKILFLNKKILTYFENKLSFKFYILHFHFLNLFVVDKE